MHPGVASAQEALLLGWEECRLTGLADEAFTCGANDQTIELFCAFRLPFGTGADVIGVEAVVDVQHSQAALPDWWLMAASGQCRSGALTAGADFSAVSACVDPWRGAATAEIQAFDIGMPRGGANQVRILAVAGLPSDSARTISASDVCYGVKIRIHTMKTNGPGSCVGCSDGACLVLNGITVRRLPGAPGGDLKLTIPAAGDGNRVTWRGGAGADCALVPVRAVTWGRIKSLYR